MSNRRQRWHLERSVVTLNALRARGIDRDVFEAVLFSDLPERSRARRVSVRHLWAGGRPLRFDPAGPAPSELEDIEAAWPGTAYFFFHPLWNLFAPPPRSTEKYRLNASHAPAWMHQDEGERLRAAASDRDRRVVERRLRALQAHEAALDHASRIRQRATGRCLDLRVVHACLLQLPAPLRDQFMVRTEIDIDGVSPVDIPWTRVSLPMEAQLDAIAGAPLIDGLAATLALTMEAGLIGRERDHRRGVEALERMRSAVRRAGLFEGVADRVLLGVRHAATSVGVLETHLVQAQLEALPDSWRRRATQWALNLSPSG